MRVKKFFLIAAAMTAFAAAAAAAAEADVSLAANTLSPRLSLAQQTLAARMPGVLRDLVSTNPFKVNEGESTVNGAKIETTALSMSLPAEDLAARLRSALTGVALVAVHHTNVSDVIVATPLGVSDREESVRQGYVISVINLPNGARLGVGSAAGDLLKAHLRTPQLSAPWVDRSRSLLRPVGTTSHRFADTFSRQEILLCEESIERCRVALTGDLRRDGYVPVNPDEKVDAESNVLSDHSVRSYSGVWRKGQTTMHVNISQQGAGAPAEVGVYEVSAK